MQDIEAVLDDTAPLHFYPGADYGEAASAAQPLDDTNKGWQLLQRLGWRGGGLGKNEDGMSASEASVDEESAACHWLRREPEASPLSLPFICAGRTSPVPAGVEAGVRLGLGKQTEDDQYTAADGIVRKRLEVEIQADEDPERTRRREVNSSAAPQCTGRSRSNGQDHALCYNTPSFVIVHACMCAASPLATHMLMVTHTHTHMAHNSLLHYYRPRSSGTKQSRQRSVKYWPSSTVTSAGSSTPVPWSCRST